jgi:hypothetical protein
MSRPDEGGKQGGSKRGEEGRVVGESRVLRGIAKKCSASGGRVPASALTHRQPSKNFLPEGVRATRRGADRHRGTESARYTPMSRQCIFAVRGALAKSGFPRIFAFLSQSGFPKLPLSLDVLFLKEMYRVNRHDRSGQVLWRNKIV